MDDFDIDEMKAMFLEECSENIDILETGLLSIGDDANSDTLNEVFRAAHSIKGGGATFGFAELSELTHHMETLLDQMRSGQREVNDSDVELLLQSVDLLRGMSDGEDNGDDAVREEMQKKLAAAVDSVASNNDNDEPKNEIEDHPAESVGLSNWHIKFVPNLDMMTRGNDPLLILRELARLGDVKVNIDSNRMPEWNKVDPKQCYLVWNVELTSVESKDAIIEVFEWVELDCELEINLITNEDKVEDEKPEEEKIQPIEKKQVSKNTKKPAASSESSSIRIATDKVDHLINLVGELVITQSMLNRAGMMDEELDKEKLRERLVQLERNTRELQESVMRVRMLPISFAFSRLPRLVRDLSKKLDKKINLVVEGEATELDKTVLERMMDPFVHLVRNAIDHGLERPSERKAAGKEDEGCLKLRASHQGSNVVIEISDDGKGIDGDRILALAKERGVIAEDETLSEDEINQLIFAPGFSTAKEVSDVSGRGVGMDVVRRNIVDLGGRVTLKSTLGVGTTVTIRLPLTLAILDGQLVQISDQVFVIPILSIIETIEIENAAVANIPGRGEVCKFRGEYLPLIRLRERLMLSGSDKKGELVVVVDVHGQPIGLVIDKVVGQQQVVIKALEDNYKAVEGVTGATIMSDGSVALILDPQSLAPEKILSDAA